MIPKKTIPQTEREDKLWEKFAAAVQALLNDGFQRQSLVDTIYEMRMKSPRKKRTRR